jgi:hypothetical protein
VILLGCSMMYSFAPRNFAGLVLVSICVLILAASTVPAISPQAPMGQYPQASIRRDVRSRSCFSARMLWWIGSAPTRAGAWISTWIPRTCTRRRMSDKACAGGCATVLEVRIPGERRLANALWTIARAVWNAPTMGRKPTILVGRAAPLTRAAPVVPAFLTIPG